METALIARGARLLATGMLCVLLSVPSFAGEQVLTLPQAIELSLQNNGELKSFRDEKGIRDGATTRAGLLPNPTVEVEVETGALTGKSSENSLSIGISQELLTGGKRDRRMTVAEWEQEIYRFQLADRERMVRSELEGAFHDVILAQERIRLAERFVELNRKLCDIAKERLAAGEIPELEMNLASVELYRSEGGRIEAEGNLMQARARLHLIMGTPDLGQYHLAGTLEEELPQGTGPAELLRMALANRPDLKALEAERSKGDAEVALAVSESVPNLNTSLGVRRESSTMEIGGIEGKDTSYVLGLRLSIPIPLFDRNQGGIQEARARRSSTESRLAAASRQVEQEVRAAHAAYVNADKVLFLYRSGIIPQMEENLKLTLESYRLGELGILPVIEEQKKFFEVNEACLVALHARRQALTKLKSAVAAEIIGGVQ